MFSNFEPGTIGRIRPGRRARAACTPPTCKTIADQLDGAGLTWRDYDQSMGADPTREPVECAHPGVNRPDHTQSATATDQYATRHNPFVYFHSIIDDTALCDTHVVNLEPAPPGSRERREHAQLRVHHAGFVRRRPRRDVRERPARRARRRPTRSSSSGFRRSRARPRSRSDNGLLVIIFDEASTSDSSSCCGEIPGPNSPEPGINGPGGGDIGAVLLSPCIKPGTVSQSPTTTTRCCGASRTCSGCPTSATPSSPARRRSARTSSTSRVQTTAAAESPPTTKVRAPALASSAAARPRIPVSWSANQAGAAFTVEVRDTDRRRARGARC